MNNESIWIKILFDFMEQKGDIGKERKIIEPLVNENIRLHSIIKEIREKIENTKFAFDFDTEINKFAFDLTYMKEGQELLQILDKVGDKE